MWKSLCWFLKFQNQELERNNGVAHHNLIGDFHLHFHFLYSLQKNMNKIWLQVKIKISFLPYYFLNKKFHYLMTPVLYITNFLNCCDKIYDKINIRNENFVLVSDLRRELTHYHWTPWLQKYEAAGRVTPVVNLSWFHFCGTWSDTPYHDVVMPVRLRVDHSSVVKPLWQHPHRHAQMWGRDNKGPGVLKGCKGFSLKWGVIQDD